MVRRGSVLLLVLIIVASLVLAAGGGGGGGSSSSGSSSSGGGSSSSSGGGSGIYFSNLKCSDAGVLSFKQRPMVKPVVAYNLDDGSIIEVEGMWDGPSFVSEEAELWKKGKYELVDLKNGNKTVECPGLAFSCKQVVLSLKKCVYDDGQLEAEFTLRNASKDDVKFEFQTEDKKLVHSKTSFSSELSALSVQLLGNENYLVLVKGLEASQVQVSLSRCVGKHYIYEKIDCVKKKDKKDLDGVQAVSGKALKCGGYMDIQDRVKCRLQLREEQRNEYENFFPEECKARADVAAQEKCLEVYQAVQECWDFPNGQARINCVKKVLKLGDIITERANCNGLDVGKREDCNNELREKVYALVKFRLYNLEEEAEEFMEDGELSLDDVTSFVVRMEQHKLAFNKAVSKNERKTILVSARQDWLDLLQKVNK